MANESWLYPIKEWTEPEEAYFTREYHPYSLWNWDGISNLNRFRHRMLGWILSSLATRRRHFQNLTSQIWKEFVIRYVRQLHIHHKWPTKETPLNIGQVVLVIQPHVQKGYWPLGIVQDVIKGKDGQVRNVTVCTTGGVITRNCTAIAPLAWVDQPDFFKKGGNCQVNDSRNQCKYVLS